MSTMFFYRACVSWRSLLPLFMVVLVTCLAIGLTRDPSALPSALIDRPIPDFTLQALDQSGTVSAAQFTGKPLVINFWASWCGACLAEHKELVRMGLQSVAGGHYSMLGINSRDDPDNARQFLVDHGDLSYVSAVDPKGRVGIDFGVYGMPETFFIDASGAVQYRHTGALTPGSIAAGLALIGVAQAR